MNEHETMLKETLKANGYDAASADDVYYPHYQSIAAHSAWSNWGPKSKIPSLTQVEYEK